MKQIDTKLAEEAIKKTENIKQRLLGQGHSAFQENPEPLFDSEEFERQIEYLHLVARINREKAAGKLAERLREAGYRRGRERFRWLRLAMTAAAVILVGVCLYPLIWNGEGYDSRLQGDVLEKKIIVPTLFREQDQKVIAEIPLDKQTTGNTYVVAAGGLSAGEVTVAPVRYEKVVIPSGYTYSVTLSDGSSVVLNAGSELRFPDRFGDSVRAVELRGEGYFEVAKSEIPFVVRVGETKVTVYGTRFNLFYSDRLAVTEAVLVEGSIGLTVDGKEIKICPNQRISYTVGDQQPEVEEVNTDDYLQWLTNNFKYNRARLDRIAFDLSMWYGVEIKVTPEIADEIYSLEFGKELPVDEVMWAFRKITGKTIKKEGGAYKIE